MQLLMSAFLSALALFQVVASPASHIGPCPPGRFQVPARCGVFYVAEDRSAKPGGRKIPLPVVELLPDKPGAEDPILFLVGGPGQAATESATAFWNAGARPILFVDQRGTGGANRLDCRVAPPAAHVVLLDSLFPGWLIAPCLRNVSTRADPRMYTTSVAVTDLAELLDWLGYKRVNLSGGSYGTRPAVEFARRYPERVRTLLLNGAIDPELNDLGLEFAVGAQGALDQLFALCRRSASCNKAFPRVREEFQELVNKLKAGPLPTTISIEGEQRRVRLGRTGFGYAVRGALYEPRLAAWLPLLFHRAHTTGDVSWFAQYFLQRAAWPTTDWPAGMYLSIICSEDMPRLPDAAVQAAAANTFLGDGLYRQYERACAGWPRGPVDPALHTPLRSAVPTLIVSGGVDPVTPPREGEHLVKTLTNVVIAMRPEAGHGGGSGCIARLRNTLLDQASVKGLDLSCLAQEPRLSFALSGTPPSG